MGKKKISKTILSKKQHKYDIIPSKSKVFSDTGNNIEKVSEFFYHLVAYGGFSLQEGVMRIWGDPSIFMPMSAFVSLASDLRKYLGDLHAKELLYWLGRLYGKNSTIMLIKKFGAKKEDIPNFVNGATQDGFGYLKIRYYDDVDTKTGEVTGTNSAFALAYKQKYGKQKEPIDWYLSGILAGGTEPLFDMTLHVEEIACMGKGDPKCRYYFSYPEKKEFAIIKKSGINEKRILDLTQSLALRRDSSFKLLGKRDIDFGDGKFLLKKVLGVNIPIYGFVVLIDILKKILTKDNINSILRNIANESIDSIKEKFTLRDIRKDIEQLEMLGLGSFRIVVSTASKIILANTNNPIAKDYVSLYGRSKEPVDEYIRLLLEEFCKKRKMSVSVKETHCLAKNDKNCMFEISLK